MSSRFANVSARAFCREQAKTPTGEVDAMALDSKETENFLE